MTLDLPLLAGILSSLIFVVSTFPMLLKASRTKDLKSYSGSHMILTNVGNLIHSVYVYSLPVGPIWLLHTFYLVTTGLMLFWYIRYQGRNLTQPNSGSKPNP